MTPPDVSLVIAAYNAARSEIIERMKLREGIVVAFVSASVAIFGGILALHPTAIELSRFSFVTPFLSLVVAIAIAQHNLAIEQIADFLRKRIGKYFTDEEQQPLHWDGYTRTGAGEIEQNKTQLRLMYHLVAIHGPCLVSLTVGWITTIGLIWKEHTPSELILSFMLAAISSLVWILAFFVTVGSFDKRFKAPAQWA